MLNAAFAVSKEDPEKLRQFFLNEIEDVKGVPVEIVWLPFEQVRDILSEAYNRRLYRRPVNVVHTIIADQALYDDLKRRQTSEGLSIKRELSFIHWQLSLPEKKRIEFQKQYLKLYALWPKSSHISGQAANIEVSEVLGKQWVDLSDSFLSWLILGREAAGGEINWLDSEMNCRAVLLAGELEREQLVDDIFKAVEQDRTAVWAASIAFQKLRRFVSIRDLEKLLVTRTEPRDLTDLSKVLGSLGDKETVEFLNKLSLDEKYSDYVRQRFSREAKQLEERLSERTTPQDLGESSHR